MVQMKLTTIFMKRKQLLKPTNLKRILYILALLTGITISSSFTTVLEEEKVNWLTFEEAVKLQEKKPKMMFIDMYTEWCGWCKRMDKTTYKNPVVAKYVNEHFYAVKMDAEQKGDITYKGQTFKYVANGRRGYHELAATLMQGKMSYPTTVFLNKKMEVLQPIAGYQNAKSFEAILAFFAQEAYLTTPWPDFQKNFKSSL